MMMNMFTMFDPNININKFSVNFIFMMLMIFKNMKFWSLINSNIMMKIKTNNKTINIMINNILNMILLMNLINIIPMLFSPTSNIMFTLNLTLLMWLMTIMFSTINNMNIMFMNFSPKMTQMNLILIINIIELNSFTFLILSLSMRLMINMMMGHIIVKMINFFFIIYLYMIIEMFIIIIQTYVFFILNLINFNNMN